MKKALLIAVLFLAVGSTFLLAQDPGAAPSPINVPAGVTLIAIQVLAISKTVEQLINGLKDAVPGLAAKPVVLKVLNLAANLSANLGVCFIAGHVTEIADTAKCVLYAVIGALVTAGFYSQNKTSDLARAASSVPELKAAVTASPALTPAAK